MVNRDFIKVVDPGDHNTIDALKDLGWAPMNIGNGTTTYKVHRAQSDGEGGFFETSYELRQIYASPIPNN